MRARMRIQIGGYRDGEEWPPPGHVVDLPDVEAERLFAAGYADPVDDDAPDLIIAAPVDDDPGAATAGTLANNLADNEFEFGRPDHPEEMPDAKPESGPDAPPAGTAEPDAGENDGSAPARGRRKR